MLRYAFIYTAEHEFSLFLLRDRGLFTSHDAPKRSNFRENVS